MAKDESYTGVNTLDRYNDIVYEVINADGSVRLLKLTDEGYIELNANDGSELENISREEGNNLIGSTPALTPDQKTAYLKYFDSGGAEQREFIQNQTSTNEISEYSSKPSSNVPSKGEGPLFENSNFDNTNYKLNTQTSTNEMLDEVDAGYRVTNAPIIADTSAMDAQRFNQANYNIYASPGQTTPDNTANLAQQNPIISNYSTNARDYGTDLSAFGGKGEDITTGIKDQNDTGWGSAEGWDAAGSVMKGVGGLASAWTGMKNYQLARDAHTTQQNQWQANYNQRLLAYQDNKDLANQEIKAKNRVLRARNPNRPETDYYQSI